jgi:uncharacterized protein (TIGR03435 family)
MLLSRVFFHSRFRGFVRETAVFSLLVMSASALPVGAQVQPSGNSPLPAVSASGSPEAGGPSKLTFEAASVRPSSQKFVVKGTDFLDPVSDSAPPQGGLFSWNVPMVSLIDFAYDLRGPQVRREAWAALPKWAQDEWYTVEARAAGNPTRADVRQMVRSMLEERFQLTAHLEKRDGEVFALEVTKPGLGLKPHTEGAPCTLSSSLMDENKYPHAYPPYKGSPPRCGVFNRELTRAGERRFEMLDVTMQQIADSLRLPLAVVDRTGLAGRYDAVLDFGSNAIPQNPETSDELGLPLLPVALEKQLGLKLAKQSSQIDGFVIDHIGTLSEN